MCGRNCLAFFFCVARRHLSVLRCRQWNLIRHWIRFNSIHGVSLFSDPLWRFGVWRPLLPPAGSKPSTVAADNDGSLSSFECEFFDGDIKHHHEEFDARNSYMKAPLFFIISLPPPPLHPPLPIRDGSESREEEAEFPECRIHFRLPPEHVLSELMN